MKKTGKFYILIVAAAMLEFSDIMVTPKLGVASILCLNFIKQDPSELGAGRPQLKMTTSVHIRLGPIMQKLPH